MEKLAIFENILVDKGSRYAVSGAVVTDRAEIDAHLKQLKKQKKFAKATHHSWGVIFTDKGPVKHDDRETGAGMVIIRMLERAELTDHLIIVTRWFGGTKLGGDRFRHIQESVRIYFDETGLSCLP